jgi:hypothetical protein
MPAPLSWPTARGPISARSPGDLHRDSVHRKATDGQTGGGGASDRPLDAAPQRSRAAEWGSRWDRSEWASTSPPGRAPSVVKRVSWMTFHGSDVRSTEKTLVKWR